MVRFLERRGFSIVRVRGSHHFMDDGRHRTCVPVHGSEPLKIGTLSAILRDTEISPEDFRNLWDA